MGILSRRLTSSISRGILAECCCYSSSLPGSSSINSLPLHNPSFNNPASVPQLPWRRANVRHTSNEIYVDLVESLSVILAPSGRPLSAFANGTIACTSKLSGVPDILLSLSCPGGKSSIERVMELPVFHPCVRLTRWKETPGVLSFVPPDGKFMLAGYEVDLLPLAHSGKPINTSAAASLHMPVSIEVRTGLGPTGADFEVRLSLSNQFPGSSSSASYGNSGNQRSGGLGSRLGTASPAFGSSTNAPVLEDVLIHVPLRQLSATSQISTQVEVKHTTSRQRTTSNGVLPPRRPQPFQTAPRQP